MDIEATADTLMGLINSRPTSPTRDEVVGLLRAKAQPLPPKLGEWKMVSPASVEGKITPLVDPRIAAALDGFDQALGPPMAYNDHIASDGTVVGRYRYQVFAWKSHDLERILDRVRDLACQLKSLGARAIMWRTRPELGKQDGVYYFYCRFHVLPYVNIPGAKPEGEETPEA